MSEEAHAALFESLKTEVIHLHMYRKVYRQLYGSGNLRIDLLNETGPLVFYIFQHLLLDETTLAICRLTDPSKTGNKENHSLPRLIELVEETDADFAKGLREGLDEILALSTPYRERRNRAIAHSDLATKTSSEENPIPGINLDSIAVIVEKIAKLMNSYERRYKKGMTSYEDVLLPLGSDGNFLVEQLRRAVAFRDAERKKKLPREMWTEGRYKGA